jgi:hypothetical protein
MRTPLTYMVALLCGLWSTSVLAQQNDPSDSPVRLDTLTPQISVAQTSRENWRWRHHYDAPAGQPPALLVLDGVPRPDLLGQTRQTLCEVIGVENIEAVDILKGPAAIERFGEDARGGAVLIRTRAGAGTAPQSARP